MDPVRLSKTMAFLLRHRPEVGDLTLDGDGFVPVTDLCGAVSRLLRLEIQSTEVLHIVEQSEIRRFEIVEGRIRAVGRRTWRTRTVGPNQRVLTPDILYHATSDEAVADIEQQGVLSVGEGRHVFLSTDEGQAWRTAHRNRSGSPRVLVIDSTRARRRGVQFARHRRSGMFLASPIPTKAVLNLLPNFAQQHSAGGFPIVVGPDGRPRIALIQVTRKSGVTWEVAKGKVEPGETPEATALREVGEEMGIETPMRIVRTLDAVRYGFLAPGGLPRLKVVYLYLMVPEGDIASFTPAGAEGIADVSWFTPERAVRAVRHSSLQPVMRHIRHLLQYGLPASVSGGGTWT